MGHDGWRGAGGSTFADTTSGEGGADSAADGRLAADSIALRRTVPCCCADERSPRAGMESVGTIMEVQDLPASLTKPPPQSDLTSNIKQLEAGWSFTAILTHTGEVWVWYSDWSADAFTRTYYRGNAHAARMMADPPGNEHLSIFPVSVRPVQLPPLPTSPQSDTQDTGNKIIQIAAGKTSLSPSPNPALCTDRPAPAWSHHGRRPPPRPSSAREPR